jgi:ABC-type nitrate/sulfonate/bicarbonate transport system substrate-binding protein
MRIMRWIATLTLAVFAFATCNARADDLIPFKIGISAPVSTILPVYFAEAGGLYEKYGLKGEIINAEGGTRGIQVLLSGEIQAMHVGLAPAVLANLKGADLRLVAASTNVMPFTVFSTKRTDPPLQKGVTLGISTFGSETDIAITLLLKKLGLTRDDVTISQIGGTTQRFGAMVAGRIDAAPLLEPATTAAREKGFFIVADLAAQKTPWVFDAVVMARSYVSERPEHVLRFLKAYIEGAYRGFGEEKWAKEIIARRLKASDPKIIDATYRDYLNMTSRDLTPSTESAANVIAQLKAINQPISSDKVEDYLDVSLIGRLKNDGFLAAMQKQYRVN